MRLLGLLFIVSLVVVTLCSCTSGTAATRVVVDTETGKTVVKPGASYLNGKLVLEDIRYINVRGLLQWQAQFKNTTKKDLCVEYRVKYFNAEGWELSTGQDVWLPARFYGLESKTITGTCPALGATRVEFYFRDVKPITD